MTKMGKVTVSNTVQSSANQYTTTCKQSHTWCYYKHGDTAVQEIVPLTVAPKPRRGQPPGSCKKSKSVTAQRTSNTQCSTWDNIKNQELSYQKSTSDQAVATEKSTAPDQLETRKQKEFYEFVDTPIQLKHIDTQ